MRIGKRIFPYPVINNQFDLSTFSSSDFSLKLNVVQTEDKCILKDIYYTIDNDYIIKLISEGLIKVYCIIECSATLYRSIIEISEIASTIELDIRELNGQVSISAYGIATDTIYEFKCDDFIEDYSEYDFIIDKHDIILIDDGISFKVDYDESKDSKISSIFSVIKDMNPNQTLIHLRTSSKKINIHVPEIQFNKYDNLKLNSNIKNVFFASLLIPALVSELSKIQFDCVSETSKYFDIGDIEFDYSWFRSISKQYKKLNNSDLNIDLFKQLNIFEFAQVLVDSPISKGIDEAFQLTVGRGDDNED